MNSELRHEDKISISKIVNGLFSVLMCSLITNIFLTLASGTGDEITPLTSIPTIVSNVFIVVYGVLLIKLEEYSDSYKSAGILCIILAVINIATSFPITDSKALTTVIAIIILIIQIVKEFKEIDAHTSMMKKIPAHNLNWEKVSGTLTAYVSISIIAVVLSPLFGILGALLALVASIVYLVFSIKKWIYIKHMGRIFKESAETFDE